MNATTRHEIYECLAVQSFDPEPGALYSLDTAANLAGVSRRSILIYWKAGLLSPVVEPGYGTLYFNDEAIHAIRNIERLRRDEGINLTGVRMIFELTQELERLRTELRFLRGY
jgi:MerR family transcriptional regulator/heat shock protein HspR